MHKRSSIFVSFQQAFTLLELSIVLTIIALLAGGVVGGQALIRAAQLRAITTEKDKYQTAIYAFKDKYFMYPGDLSNAYQFWGATCGTNTTAVSTGCNGDGSGYVDQSNSTGETIKVWEHLSRAGIIEGNYDGTGAASGMAVLLSATNSPASRFPGGYWMYSADPNDAAGNPSLVGRYLTVGSPDNVHAAVTYIPSLTRLEAWSIDTKVDDGKADTGFMRGDSGDYCTDENGQGDYGIDASLGGDPNAMDCTLTFIQ